LPALTGGRNQERSGGPDTRHAGRERAGRRGRRSLVVRVRRHGDAEVLSARHNREQLAPL